MAEGGRFYVYVHSRLSSDSPFYIGKGHRSRCLSEHGRNVYWRNIVDSDGGYAATFLVTGIDNEFATLIEKEAIALFRKRGETLVNLTNGGDGTGRPCSQETRKKLAEANKGQKPTKFAIQRLIETKTGKPLSESHRRNIGHAIKGRPAPNRGKPSPLKGKTLSEIHKAKLRGREFSDELRKRMSESHKGKKLSEELKEKLKEKAKEQWARLKAEGHRGRLGS